jgi:hypothetical protein
VLTPGRETSFKNAPLENTYVSCQVSVRVKSSSGNIELSCKVFNLVNEADDGLELLVSLGKGGLELGVSINQALGWKKIRINIKFNLSVLGSIKRTGKTFDTALNLFFERLYSILPM